MHVLMSLIRVEDVSGRMSADDGLIHASLLAAARGFDRVLLLSDIPSRDTLATALQRAIQSTGSSCAIEILEELGAGSLAEILRLQGLAQDAHLFVLQGDDELRAAAMAAGFEAGICTVRIPLARSEGPASIARLERSPSASLVREPRVSYGEDTSPRLMLGDDVGAADPRAIARRTGLIGEDAELLTAIDAAAVIAGHGVPVLVQGETGTGKGVMARFIHECSPRAARPFVAVNCAALPEHLVESLLFGHVRGAFTGATSDQPGRFAMADGGTLFLDEIGELPLSLQPKLLRVLEDGVIEPLGSTRSRRVDVRVIAATHRDLQAAVADREFREDLFYRLSFATFRMPPLRERRDDIPRLAQHILSRLNRRLKAPRRLAPDALGLLREQEWRGNVRDLENVIGRTVLLSRTETLEAHDILLGSPSPGDDRREPEPCEGFELEAYLAGVRARLMDRALDRASGNRARAARLLGISAQAVSKYARDRETTR